MKKIFILIFFVILIPLSDTIKANRYSKQHKQDVEKQKTSDLKKRDAILKEFNSFLKEFRDGIPNEQVSFDIPLDVDLATGIVNAGYHYTGAIPPKIYGYVNTDSLNMRSEGDSKSEIIGKLKFKDRVEILFQADKVDVINAMQSPWLLIKKDNGDEGWVFGAYVSHSIPSEKDSDSGKTDWNMIIPASGKLSSKFGYRVDPVTKKMNSFHKGVDIAAPEGTPVYAAEKGEVVNAGYNNSGYGNLIIIQHGADLATYYGHLSKIGTPKGKDVKKGDLIGKIGSTGKVTGPHLHFEIRKGGQALNPEDFIR
ncbi:MAG: peptidoglycan DD-metalloendopeptidase family protein [Spirochaetes bacterium]|nr:peptidoglycan DD-metalloendopeptidase family protein [Spirochaetota bacterium]